MNGYPGRLKILSMCAIINSWSMLDGYVCWDVCFAKSGNFKRVA